MNGAMTIDQKRLQHIIEGALMAAGKPLSVEQISALFDEGEEPDKELIVAAIDDIQSECRGRGFELKEVASGYRFQVIAEVAPWVSRLWDEKPQKYSRALLETLALIAYRQPITRGDIEDIRGVAVSSNIIKTLMEREWIRIVGHKDVPGRPAMYATTRQFLDYFNLRNLDGLPTLAEIRDLDTLNTELSLYEEGVDTPPVDQNDEEMVDDEELKADAESAVLSSDGDIDDGDAAYNTGAASDNTEATQSESTDITVH